MSGLAFFGAFTLVWCGAATSRRATWVLGGALVMGVGRLVVHVGRVRWDAVPVWAWSGVPGDVGGLAGHAR